MLAADLLERRKTQFTLWRPNGNQNAPKLVIGIFQAGNPNVVANRLGFCQLSCPGIGTGVSAVLPFRLPPGFRALSPCDACGEGAASLPEHVGTCGTGSGESLGVRRALGNIVLLMRCS